ncbi:MAG: murein biosynthesis integral membrane protein MurJ, partial [Candidatus Zixiibacteriota bacterium]
LSRVFGLVREQVMAYYFGVGVATDAFVAAFRIPNLLRDMFAEGALSSAFVPVFNQKLVKETREDAFRLANIVTTAMLLVVGFIVLIGLIIAPIIVLITAKGFSSDLVKFNLTIDMTRIMMVFLLLVSLSALVMGMLNSFGKFTVPALSPAFFNLGTIVTVVVMYNWFDQPAYTLAIGVVIGGIAQLAVQLPSLHQTGYRFKFNLNLLDQGMKQIFKLFTPMIIGLSAGRINILISTLWASFLVDGALSYLNYSFRIMHFPLGVFAVALGTVALPKVSELVAQGDTENLNKTFYQAVNFNFFIVIPAAMFLALLSTEISRLIYQWGAFSELDTQNTALALRHYSYGLVGFAAVRVIVPFYYAFNDANLPMRISIITVVINILLYYPLVNLLDFAGLAAATSIAGLVNAIALFTFMPTKGIDTQSARVLLILFRICVASLLSIYVAKLVPSDLIVTDSTLINRVLSMAIIFAVASVAYLAFCIIFQVSEAKRLVKTVFSRFF